VTHSNINNKVNGGFYIFESFTLKFTNILILKLLVKSNQVLLYC